MKLDRSKKTVLSLAALVLALQLSLGVCLLEHEEQALMTQLNERVQVIADALALLGPRPGSMDARQRAQDLGAMLLRNEDILFCEITNEQGEMLFRGGTPDVQHIKRYAFGCPLVPARTASDAIATAAVGREPHALRGVLTLHVSVSGLHGTLAEARGILVLSGIVAVMSALFFATLMVKHAFGTPVGRLLKKARGVELGNFDHHIHVTGDDEIGQLAAALDRIAAQLRGLIDGGRKPATHEASGQNETENMSELRCAYEKLEDVNKKLNDFASVVAHDLKAPLRRVRTLVDWIVSDCGAELPPDQQEHVHLLLSQVDRMHNLIEGVLRYSRTGRDGEEKTMVDLNDAVSEAVALVAPADHIEIVVSDRLPVVLLERTQIIQVFANLVDNAVKFMDKSQGKITIGCRTEEGYWTFSVADNGPGIDEAEHQRIFRLFQTASPGKDGDGTGIGLTLVRRIVETYGGTVWVESRPGNGSTFFFTLPMHREQLHHERLRSGTPC